MKLNIVRIVPVFLILAAGCAPVGTADTKKPTVKEAEAVFVKMFSDASGKAAFTCTAGGGRYDYICDGRYVPSDRAGRVIAQRIGANLSHYFEGEPVFAITVIKDAAR